MSETNETHEASSEEEERAPKRVIGTPPQVQSHDLLPSEGDGGEGSGYKLDPVKARKAERAAAFFFFLTFVAGIAFIVFYAVWPGHVGNDDIVRAMHSNYALGTSLTVIFLGMAVGMTIWVRHLMTTKEIIQERHELASPAEDRQVFNEYFLQGAEESGITKRPLLRRSLLLASAPLGLLPILLLRDLGPLPKTKLRHTSWKKGTRLVVDGTGQPLKPSDFNSPGGIITVIPEGAEDNLDELAKATVLLINVPEDQLKVKKGRENWNVGGIIAYSKICTHVGCPAALYEQTTHHILCPCHQSTFDALDGAKVIFGPAARPLPQLPLGVDSEGYLIAMSDFHEPVGPSFWERGRPKA
ncbi:Rieske (2Fe-2S) protein [Actinoallomurus spadix]|uniref:Cytochrome bc1 complex Rieske iron-sulfur subunit n=1 Tax=Actinoallomurus spadix TaxID=79912 RepID=A0ABN0W4Q7_9ACTN|nr:Rieske 2Fe-2S domain-containing protein [Actinoallomurus spadix]MCO5991370.1 Rieske (2Fe-2S) protein [Actinoallomurus spadix]